MQMYNYGNRNNRNNADLYGSSSSGGGGFNSKARGEQFRSRAVDGISKLNETDDLMANSMRLVNDSKELGVATLVKVDEQTEILVNTKQNVDETLMMSNNAGSILNNMAYRYCANKALLWVIIVVLIAANVGVYLLNHPAGTPSKKPSKPTTRLLHPHDNIRHMPAVAKQHHVAFIQKSVLPKQLHNNAKVVKTTSSNTQKASLNHNKNVKHEVTKMVEKINKKNNRRVPTTKVKEIKK